MFKSTLVILLLFWYFPILLGQNLLDSSTLIGQIEEGNALAQEQFDFTDDSLFVKFRQSILEIDAPSVEFDAERFAIDSLISNYKLMPTLSGQLEAGYEYGLLTGYVDPDSTSPLNVFNTRGDVVVEAFKLPFNVSYNYSSFKNPLGVNNYFRVSMDMERLKQNATDKKNEAIEGLNGTIGEVSDQKDLIQGKLGMGEVLQQKLKREIAQQEKELKKYQAQLDDMENKAMTSASNLEQSASDGLNQDQVVGYAEKADNGKTDSLRTKYNEAKQCYDKAVALYDTINKVYQKALKIYETYSNLQSQLEEKKELVNAYKNKYNKESLQTLGDEKKESFLSSIKTLDIGLTYPSATALSKNGVPVQGINLEFQRKKWYTVVCAGVTMNNLMVTADVIDNKLTNTQNMFNQFDFQNMQERGLLTSIKTGYGTKEGQHYFIGFRYLTNSPELLGVSDSILVPSLGAELDIRFIPTFVQGMKVDLVYGKTSNRETIADSLRKNVFGSLFSSDRTNTGLIRLSQQFALLRTEVQGSLRWLDPMADTRSLGVLQPNNVRYEVRTNTRLPFGIDLGLNYRRDRNNVANWSDTTLYLNVIGGQLNGKISKDVSYFGSLNYLTQDLKGTNINERTYNYMFGGGLSATYKLGEIKNAATLSYNDYLISDSISTGLFRNIGIQNMSKFESGTNTLSLNYFKMDDPQLPINSSLVLGDEFTTQRDKFSLTLGIKLLFSEEYGSDMGGKVECTYRITKQLSWFVSAEKLILGDFYNYYSIERFNRFPYALMTRITYTLN